ncbi:uncharacterized membrane protein HdeD (DUF308 family) [Lactobacillus colini]|uniref:Uncharacterized membrane protein HdeD (DUF308 family) n=1 Tax=Lactobacillus colini TaxID=1819254 RepID=A0ABS4MDA0_9LACO|nr:DUF308 domain-containing protein [Lactobacillus colini]MBP2057667.1 uncharacterized membrane protein HdeD (DUF308 family) [Lactobacillus colini]
MNNLFNSDRPRGFDWGALLAGVLLVITSFILLRYPGRGLAAFVFLFAILSIMQGIIWIYMYSKFRDFFARSWVTLISGILDIIVGLIFLFSHEIGGLTIAVLFAVWFFVDSVVGVVFSWHLRDYSNGYFILSLILNVISLLIAITLMFNPVLAAITLVYLVAFWLMVFGFNEIFVAFMHR